MTIVDESLHFRFDGNTCKEPVAKLIDLDFEFQSQKEIFFVFILFYSSGSGGSSYFSYDVNNFSSRLTLLRYLNF